MNCPGDTPILEARNVHFGYRRPVLEGVSLGVTPGIVTGIIGPNGSGKTTVLRLLDGIIRPHSGEILFDGRHPLLGMKRREIARRIAMVPQNGRLQHPLSVYEFVMQGRTPHLPMLGFESEHDDTVVWRALEATKLAPLAKARVSEISGGEKQRLLLARALAQECRILLLDELTANLDINYQVELMRLIRETTRERKLATLVVSHEINLLAAFADRLVLLSEGRVRAEGSPAEVLTRENLETIFALRFTVRPAAEGHPEIIPQMFGPGR